ncbi:hypothetical protein ACFL2O_07405 [Thermodesulfobacteriota bacterium]
MAEIIDIQKKFPKPSNNVITPEPWEFRRPHWETGHFIQMLRSQSDRLEKQYRETLKGGGNLNGGLPIHFTLNGGIAYTIRAIFVNREDKEKMLEIYYLSGLMDCIINQVSPILRTDLLRGMYKKIFNMKEKLNVHWYGPIDQVLLPIDSYFFNEFEYRASLKSARTLKDLYMTIRNGTEEMFDLLSTCYVFYCPRLGG